jgi:hypothetical protein
VYWMCAGREQYRPRPGAGPGMAPSRRRAGGICFAADQRMLEMAPAFTGRRRSGEKYFRADRATVFPLPASNCQLRDSGRLRGLAGTRFCPLRRAWLGRIADRAMIFSLEEEAVK